MERLTRILAALTRWGRGLCALVLVLMALYVSLGRELAPLTAEYRAEVEARAGEALGMPLQIGELKGIATKQFEQKPLTEAQARVLRDVVQVQKGSGETRYNGWYPKLFYKGQHDCGKWDALVADVHTDVPAPILGDPGCVLTQGIGNIDLLLIAIDSGKDKMVYAGPLLSHYEFEMPGITRKADSEWKKDFIDGKVPARPTWTKSYLIPGTNPDVKNYQYQE